MLHFPPPLIEPTGFTARHTEKITNRNPDSPAGSQPTGDHPRIVPELASYLRFCLSASCKAAWCRKLAASVSGGFFNVARARIA